MPHAVRPRAAREEVKDLGCHFEETQRGGPGGFLCEVGSFALGFEDAQEGGVELGFVGDERGGLGPHVLDHFVGA